MLFSGCENMQPTEVSNKDLKDKVTVSGYARYQVNNSSGKVQDARILADQDLILYYGMKDADGKMSYTHYDLKTDEAGFFSKELPLAYGKVIIDEVKVVCSFSLEGQTYGYNTNSNRWELTDADFYGEVAKQNLAAGSAYYYDIVARAVAYTSSPNLQQPN